MIRKMKEEYILDTFDLPTVYCTSEFMAICDKLGALHIKKRRKKKSQNYQYILEDILEISTNELQSERSTEKLLILEEMVL